MAKNVRENIPATFAYQMSSCVLVVPQYTAGIVASEEIAKAVGGKHTQLVESPEGEIAVYNTLQVVNVAQPPPQASISVTQMGDQFAARLVRVSQIAFEKALEDQRGVALGINFTAVFERPKQAAKAVVFGLLSQNVTAHRDDSGAPLTNAGLRLIFDMAPWVATISIEANQSNDEQLTCGVNFNMNKPAKKDVGQIHDADKLREWFEQMVRGIVGGGIDGSDINR